MSQASLDNRGAIYQNQGCSARFVADLDAVTTDHSRRSVRALAAGDLDRNGFVDLVVPSEMNVAESVPLEPNPLLFGSPYDAAARFARFWAETPQLLMADRPRPSAASSTVMIEIRSVRMADDVESGRTCRLGLLLVAIAGSASLALLARAIMCRLEVRS